jgi:molybdate transport system ATP-binding protein
MAFGILAAELFALSAHLKVCVEGGAGDFRVSADFSSPAGITGLFGHSGAGKSTLLKMIAGLLCPERGRIELSGRTLFDAHQGINISVAARRTGFVFQDARLFPHMPVRGNLTYAGRFGGRAGYRTLDDVSDLLGLGHLLERRPASLSGGERQRVAIGRALLSDPAILLMDEPLSSLDHARRQEVLPYLERMRAETSIPIIYVSHEVDEVARLADTLVVLSHGEMVASGPAVDVFGRADLGPALGRHEAGALVEGKVIAIDSEYGLARVAAGNGEIELVAPDFKPGSLVRMRVRARDVAIARALPVGISIRNRIGVRVEEIVEEAGPYVELVLDMGGQALRARITRKSHDELGLKKGEEVFALLKAISVERRAVAAGIQNP